MVFHTVAYQVGHLVVSTVFVFPEGVKYSPLYRFQSVCQVRNGPVRDNVGCVLKEVFPIGFVNAQGFFNDLVRFIRGHHFVLAHMPPFPATISTGSITRLEVMKSRLSGVFLPM